MRRLVFPIIVAFGLVMIGAGGAFAEPAGAGKKICKVTDPRLDELSGIVATKRGFIVINDSTALDDHKRVFYLNDRCTVTNTVRFGGNGPRDTEDVVLSPDGETLWIADTGDNELRRTTIAVWSMPVDGSARPRIHRLSYPAGERHDAEAMLLSSAGTPIIITKEVGQPAGIYTPAAALQSDNLTGVPLKRVGQLTVPPSTTSASPVVRLGRGTVVGGAIAPGGGRVVLRTYTDALEWTVSGGDVLAAIQGKPRVTPLPDEPLGEAITYSPDGTYFYTVSDMQGDPAAGDNYILRYTPATTSAPNGAATGAPADDKGPSWLSSLSMTDITYLVAGVGLLGAVLVGLGVFGIVRARRRPASDPADGGDRPDDRNATDAETEIVTVPGAQGQLPAQDQQPGVYGVRQPGGHGEPAVSGIPSGSGPQRGVYGGVPPADDAAPGSPLSGRPNYRSAGGGGRYAQSPSAQPPAADPGGFDGHPPRPSGYASPDVGRTM